MSFSEVLKEITEDVAGAIGAGLVGMDGIVVEEYVRGPAVDIQSIGAEYGNILKGVQNASTSLKMGTAREVAVQTEMNHLVIRKINDDYFLALIISGGGNFGKGRFVLRMAANRLEKEF